MVVLVVSINRLVGQETAILSDRHILVLQELIQLSATIVARIVIEVVQEPSHWFYGQTLLHKGEDSFGDTLVNDLTAVIHRTVFHLDVVTEIRIECLGDVHQLLDVTLRATFRDRVDYHLCICVVTTESVRLPVDDRCYCFVSYDVVHTYCVLSFFILFCELHLQDAHTRQCVRLGIPLHLIASNCGKVMGTSKLF